LTACVQPESKTNKNIEIVNVRIEIRLALLCE
jgi:hypothetical protein